MEYKVPVQPIDYVPGNGYFKYSGSNMYVDIVECSNRLVPIRLEIPTLTVIFVDLANGNVVSGYRPGGHALLLGNIIDFYDKNNYSLPLSNFQYWMEAYYMGEVGGSQLGSSMAESPDDKSVISRIMTCQQSQMGVKLTSYLLECAAYVLIIKDVFVGRKSRLKEYSMISHPVIVDGALERVLHINSYFRARNKDFELMYCRDSDKYYIAFANKYQIGTFGNTEEIVKNLRKFTHLEGFEYIKALSNCDKSVNAELHDFMLDLEKLNKVLKIS